MMNTVVRVLHADPGFHPNHLLTLEVRLIGKKYFDISQWEKTGLDLVTPQVGIFCKQVLERLRALPGVESAGLIDWLPMLEDAERFGTNFAIAGRPAVTAGERPGAMFSAISPEYFRVMQIRLLKGRDLTEQDAATAPWVVVINDAMARKFWPNQDPIGKVITLDTQVTRAEERPREIVGVVGNVRQFRLGMDPFPEIYAPYPQQAQHCTAGATETRLHKSLVLRTNDLVRTATQVAPLLDVLAATPRREKQGKAPPPLPAPIVVQDVDSGVAAVVTAEHRIVPVHHETRAAARTHRFPSASRAQQ